MSRQLIVSEYVSLDGVIQGPGHAGEDREGGFENTVTASGLALLNYERT